MDEERGIYGTFNNGLNVGANQPEQMSAGVNQFDNATTAFVKVSNARLAADAALSAKLQAQGYYGHGVKAESPPPWKLIINLLLVVALAYACFAIYDSGKYRVAESSWVDLKNISVNNLDGRKYNEPSLTPLFQPGTKLDDLYKACKTKNCQRPDIQAFDSYRRFAARPESYENDLCSYYLPNTATAPEQLQPTWTIERKASQCTVTNAGALRAEVQARNKSYMVKIAVFAAVMLSILAGLNILPRRRKP